MLDENGDHVEVRNGSGAHVERTGKVLEGAVRSVVRPRIYQSRALVVVILPQW